MPNTAITRHELTRRREQLDDLLRYLGVLEGDHEALRQRLLAFRARYADALGKLYEEHDALEAQLHAASALLAEALKRQGVEVPPARPPKAKRLPEFAPLPARTPMPVLTMGDQVELAPPSLKTLYRRAAMRLHPDLAPEGSERDQREQQMMVVNEAYANNDRARLEALLLAAGEPRSRVLGGHTDAQRHWLGECEQWVQARLRVVQAQFAWLRSQPWVELSESVARAETKGLMPLDIMARRLRDLIHERRAELYIGERLQADSGLAADFLRQRAARARGG
jgi:hypothetical protein